MNLGERIDLMVRLGNYLGENTDQWQQVKQLAFEKNKWFTEEFIDLATLNITAQFLGRQALEKWVTHYHLDNNIRPKTIGIVMAGNIPLVGFHDFLSVFISGHRQDIKLSEKDNILAAHLVEKLTEWDPSVAAVITVAERLQNCDAYIATGSNNSSRYFNYYFGRYPSIIRHNKTSVAILSGKETEKELSLLADDVYTFFGLGCRNVTKLYVPVDYDFVPLLQAFRKYNYLADHVKYRNNYDYNLALLIMNSKKYMSNDSILLLEDDSIFTPVSQLHYTFYRDKDVNKGSVSIDENIQCIVGAGGIAFGQSQRPGLFDYADGKDTMAFLLAQ